MKVIKKQHPDRPLLVLDRSPLVATGAIHFQLLPVNN